MPEKRIPMPEVSSDQIIEQKIYLADTYAEIGKYERALTVLHEVLALNPDHYHAHLQAGYCFLHLNKLSEAYREACEVVRLHPYAAEGYRLLAYMYFESKEYATSLKAIDQALEINPEDESMYTLRACIYLNMGNSPKAITEANTALSIDPESEQAAHVLAIALCNRNRHTETIRLTYEALQRNPDSATAWYQKGIQLQLDHKYRAAKYAFFQALSKDPEMNEAKEQLDAVLISSLPWYRPERLPTIIQAIILFILWVILVAANAVIALVVLMVIKRQQIKIKLFPAPKPKIELYEWDIKAWEQVQQIEATAFHGMEQAEEFMLNGQMDAARMALRPALRYAPLDPVIHQSCLTSMSGQFILKRWCWRLLFFILRISRIATYIVAFILLYISLIIYIESPLSKKSVLENILIIVPFSLGWFYIVLRSCYFYLRWGLLRI